MNTIITIIKNLIKFIIHIDTNLAHLFTKYGLWIYGILFLIIFIETGLVVMPFLPGDSLLFASWALAGNPENGISVHLIWIIVFFAAVIGDTINYEIGKFLGPKVFSGKHKLIKKEHLEKTQQFYDKHGGKTIIYARFVPIVRTFAPFVAGIGKMKYQKFISFNLIGALLWTLLFVYAGFFFGSLAFVQKRFTIIILAIIILSLVPMLIEWIKHKKNKKENPQ